MSSSYIERIAAIILGASDPEMGAIEGTARAAGVPVFYASADGGRSRVNPGTAYQTTAVVPEIVPAGGTIFADPIGPGTFRGERILAVECDGDWFAVARLAGIVMVACDHHRPNDPGFGRPAAEFWEASSVGQVYRHLADGGQLPASFDDDGWERSHPSTPPLALRMAAAADHCPGAAYRGECPGVDPDQLMTWRATTRAKFQGRPVAAVLADVESAVAAIKAAPSLVVGLGYPTWDGYPECPGGYDPDTPTGYAGGYARIADFLSATVPELPEAALRLGVATLATVVEKDGRRKVVLGGNDPRQAEIVSAFLVGRTGVAVPLTGVYGDPARGFAGGYLPA